ncbi:MAG TPA: universal stress protein [Thermoplasmata archaeon]|nr:universal stress protein [Thermoplasmata archaeon]
MKKESEVFLMKEYKKILIPTDGSPGAEEAVKKGLSLAKLIGAEVLALYVKDYRILAGLPETEEVIFIGNGLEQEGKGAIEFVKKEAKNLGVKCEGKIVEGHPQAKIVEVADEENCDLIVMGTKGRTGLAHFFLGSVTEGVIHHANCPVFIVREKSKK